MHDVYVGIGSNIEPARHLRYALDTLGESFSGLECSAVYRSPPYGFSGPDFLNMVIAFASDWGPGRVEAVLSEVETTGGRAPRRDGSRTLDLDLLLYGLRVDPARRLPRADVLVYPFVLAPLAKLAPRLVHPVTGESMAGAWRRMAATGQPLKRLGPVESLA